MIRNEHVSVLHNKGSSWDHFISSLCLVHPRTFLYVNVWGDFSQSYRILDPPPFFEQGSYSVPAAFWKYLKTIREFQREIQTIPDSLSKAVCVWLLMLSSLWENLMDSYPLVSSISGIHQMRLSITEHEEWSQEKEEPLMWNTSRCQLLAMINILLSGWPEKWRVLILVLFST